MWFNSLIVRYKILESQTLQKVIFRDVLLKGKTFLLFFRNNFYEMRDSKNPSDGRIFYYWNF